MNKKLELLGRESKDGSYVVISKIDKFYSVNYADPQDAIAFPKDVFETLDDAVDFAEAFLENHPGAGFDAGRCVKE